MYKGGNGAYICNQTRLTDATMLLIQQVRQGTCWWQYFIDENSGFMFHFNQDYLFMTLILLDIVGDKFILVNVEIKDVDLLRKFVFPISAVT